ncbi:MAG: hypothetical protein Q8W45_06945 [Candidatus Palauibacterales bacterium]|nr:hypothetical protein [Candidatus Palauibacterales bacterium]MDP2483001.1 hypothetical protein [Candidatus Palauibacterales bacterium]
MSTTEFLGPAAATGAFAALVLLLVFIHATRRRRGFVMLVTSLASLSAALFAALSLVVLIGTRGYRALTREEVAARVWTVPDTGQTFAAHVQFPDSSVRTFRLTGDELYIDAHILKWKPLVNVLGLHTEYELDRIGGRYVDLEQEMAGPRTVYALGQSKLFDLFHLRRALPLLSPLVDAEYGSATFVTAPVEKAMWEIRVSTSGLLIRPADPQQDLPDPAN